MVPAVTHVRWCGQRYSVLLLVCLPIVAEVVSIRFVGKETVASLYELDPTWEPVVPFSTKDVTGISSVALNDEYVFVGQRGEELLVRTIVLLICSQA